MNCCCAPLAASCLLGDAVCALRHTLKEGGIPEKDDTFPFHWMENALDISNKKVFVKAENPTHFPGQATVQTITEFLGAISNSCFWVKKDELYRSPRLDIEAAMSSEGSQT